MRGVRLPPMGVASSGSSATVGSMASFPGLTADTCCRAWRFSRNRGRGSSRLPRNPPKMCQARAGFLRYDRLGISVPRFLRLFPAAIRAGDAAGSQGRRHSMTGSGNGNITIGHVWGIPIQINLSTFLILALVTWSLGGPEGLVPNAYPE